MKCDGCGAESLSGFHVYDGAGDLKDAALAADPGTYCIECVKDRRAAFWLPIWEAEKTEKYHSALLKALPASAIADLGAYAKADGAALDAALDIEAWLGDEPTALWLHGAVGTGKTTLAALAARARSANGTRVTWLNAPALLRSAGSFELPPSDTHLIVLDDLGAERRTPSVVDRLGVWADAAYNAGPIPVLVTSNYKPSEIIEKIDRTCRDDCVTGLRIVSRLAQGSTVVEIGGESRR